MRLLKTVIFGRPGGIRRTALRHLLRPGPGGQASAPRSEPPPPAGEKALNLGVEAPRDLTPPEGYEVVLHRDALRPGQVVEVIIAGRAVAVCRTRDGWFALSNSCAHAQGPLGEGRLDGTVLTCPHHGWRYEVTDGSCLTQPGASVPTFPIRVVGEAVCIAV